PGTFTSRSTVSQASRRGPETVSWNNESECVRSREPSSPRTNASDISSTIASRSGTRWVKPAWTSLSARSTLCGDVTSIRRPAASGRYVVRGFIDAHVHLESSKLMLDEFAPLVLPLGTTTVVVEPHEIANVLGTDGVHWLLDACAELPLDVFVMASSCVPASSFEHPRRPLSPGDLEGL